MIVADVDEERARETVGEIAARGGTAAFVHADVACDADVRGMVAFAEHTLGGLDVLVNNAGGIEPPYFPGAPIEPWTRVLDVNLRGLMLTTQYGIEVMRRRGGGVVVNVSSVAGLGSRAHAAPEYAAAKAAVVRLTTALRAVEDGRIRINGICPDWVDTPAVRRSVASLSEEELASAPPVLVPADEIADAIVELVRNDSLTGRVMVRWHDEPRRRLLAPNVRE